MNRRHLLALVGLACLSLTAGCFGPGAISGDQLDQEPAEPYAWDTERDVHIAVQTDSSFRAVYNVSGESIELFRRDGFGGRNPLNVRAVRYRYPNGTVLTGSELEARGGGVDRTREVVTVAFPNGTETGQLAFTAGATPKRFSLPVFVEGSYEVVLPPNRRVDLPVFGTVSPRGSSREVIDGQTHIRWEEVTSRGITVQYYLQRDIPIFGAIAAVSMVIGFGGAYYYKRQIDRLREMREEMGLDVEVEEKDDGPPPGMR
ncbi:hypothetical protein C2R22_07515 [Salinigranum rubrum]|uniref:Uncharacterized protein n=1 Tax=Salinigranum rubrum TaxID=755307 RepID=A0A2I8VHY1_9EURY|nr:DUF5803 family protein [Salinigranum rubrum]AUV81520.1 hypothetical protein C2R22_07515 [Salinigranum rubrum]